MKQRISILIAVVLSLSVSPVRAATYTWGTTGAGGSGTWSDTNAWYDGASQQTWNNATPDAAVFANAGGTVALTQAQTADSVTFNSFTGTYTVGTTGQSLAINGGGLTMNSGAGAVTISSPVTLGAAQAWTNNSSSLLTAAGSVTNGGNLLTVAGSGSMTFSGVIAGAGGLTKSGAGTLTLSAANTLTGPITVSSGTLLLGNNSAGGAGGIVLGDASTGTNPVAVASNVGITSSANITVSALGTGSATIGSSGGGSAITYTGTLTLNRATTLQGLSSDRTTFNGKITGNVGTLTFGGNRRITIGSTAGANDFVGDVVVASGAQLQLSVGGVIPDASAVTLNGSGILYLANNITETIGSLSGDTAAVVSIQTGVTGLNTMVVGANNASTTFAGSMTNGPGTFAFTKIGSGTQTLSGANTYTGTTTIGAGTLRIGDGGTTGSLSTSTAITGSAGATIAFQRTDAITVSNTISGAVGVAQLGSGTLTLTAANAYSGATSVSAGTLQIGNGGAAGSIGSTSGVSVASGATLAFNRTDSYGGTFNRVVSGSGGIRVLAGTLTLGGSNTYSGPTVVAGGTLAPTAATALGQSALIIAGAAPGGGGVLDVTSLGSGLSVASGRTLGGYGTVLGNVTIAGAGVVSPGGSIGSLTNTGTQTWEGAGRYLFEITNANGDGTHAGSRWDLLTVSNLLITATSSSRFVVDLQSLTNAADNVAGLMSDSNWDANTSYQWKFLEATGTTFSAANFDPAWFTVNSGSFLNPTNGVFSVARGGVGGLGGSTTASELYVVYVAVPEPGALVLAGVGLLALGWSRARRGCREA